MKKTLRTVSVFFLLTFMAATTFGQTMQLADSAGVLKDSAEITILRVPVASSEIACTLFLKNLTSSSVDVGVFRTVISAVPNTDNYFCWGACYPPFVDTGSISVTVPKAKWDSTFIAHYSYENPTGVFNHGTSKIRYTFFDTQNPSNTVTVTVNYVVGTAGIPEANANRLISRPFPNPANSTASFTYEVPSSSVSASLSVRNLIGIEVKNIPLNTGSGKAVVNTADLPSGIYLYSLLINDRVSFTNKLVVRH